MKVMEILFVFGALEAIPKGFAKELEDLEIRGQVKTIQTIALLRSNRILKKVLGTLGKLLSFRLHLNTISKRWWERLASSNSNNQTMYTSATEFTK